MLKKLLLSLLFASFVTFGWTATLNSIQKGTITLPHGSSSITQSITSVDLTKSFLVFSVRINSNRPGRFQIGGHMTADDEITFDRYESNTDCVIEWQVFEFTSGVFVQRGTVTNLPAAGTNVTLGTAVNQSNSFVMITMHKDGGTYGSDDGVTGNLSSPTNLYLDRQPGGANVQFVYWQVVEWTASNVQKIVATLPAGSDSIAVTLPTPVNKNKAMVVGNHRVSANVRSDDLPGTELLDNNTVAFTRVGTAAHMYFIVYVVEFTDNTDVIHGAVRMLSWDDNVSTTICDVFSGNTAGIISPSNFGRAGNNCFASDDNVGHSWVTLSLTDNTTVNVRRTNTGSAARFPFQVLELTAATPTSCTPPEPGASTPRTNNGIGLCSVILPIELIYFDGTFNESENQVELSWATASELNNDYFVVQRSKDGIIFEDVLTVDGAGTSTTRLDYADIDKTPFTGIRYYRLQQVDFDGADTYSDVVSVQNNMTTAETEMTIFPNPVSPKESVVNIKLDEPAGEEVLVVVKDICGQEFYSKVQIIEEGQTITAIPIDNRITSGIYFIMASSENALYSRKLVVQ